jgi:GTPase SAR1 family protein
MKAKPKQHSFERAKRWVKRLQTEVDSIHIALVGNKLDLDASRTVAANVCHSCRSDRVEFSRSMQVAQHYAEDTNVSYSEVSAKTGEKLPQLFSGIGMCQPGGGGGGGGGG